MFRTMDMRWAGTGNFLAQPVALDESTAGPAWNTEFVASIRGVVTRWVDDAFPGWVEVRFTDADGNVVVLTDKVPVFGLDARDIALPCAVELSCVVLRHERQREVAVVALGHDVLDREGRNQFRVLADEVV